MRRLLSVPLLILLGLSGTMAKGNEKKSKVYKGDDGTIRVRTPEVAEALRNPWPKEQEDAYWKRATPLILKYTGKHSSVTTGELEKHAYPSTILAYLAGGQKKALEVLQGPDHDNGNNPETLGIDLYWGFTLKGQARKYFFFKDELAPAYREKMKKAGQKWTSSDPRPTLELVLALEDKDADVRAHALALLKKMFRDKDALLKMAAEAEKESKQKGHGIKKDFVTFVKAWAESNPPEDPGEDVAKWRAWWAHIAKGGWQVFEEYERRVNPNPHPTHGIGSGPVGATWGPNTRGMRADARNTDNLRGMREVAVYLFAEETGNEKMRKVYKQKIRRTAFSFLNTGNGEWDSPAYHGHAFTSYVNLYDFAKDPEVAGYAKAILDFLSTAAAVKYYRGAWGGPNKRDYGTIVSHSGACSTVYPYFGTSPVKLAHAEDELAYIFTSSYRPPMAVVKLAEKKFPQPLELLNSHPAYETWLPGADAKPQFHETMYYAHTYQMGTLARGSRGDMSGMKLLIENGAGAADFIIGGSARKSRIKNYPTSTAYGDSIAQFRNLVLFLNGSKPAGHFFFLLPKQGNIETDGGIIFVQGHRTWMAIRPVNVAYNTAKLQAASTKGKGKVARVMMGKGKGGKVAGYVLEVGEAKSHGDYAAFKKAVKGKGKLDLSAVDKGTVSYTGALGQSIKMTVGKGLPDVHRNGKLHDWKKHYAVYAAADGGKAPVHLGWKERVLRVEVGGHVFEGTLQEDGKYVSKSSKK